jgi:hypothetical protein
MIRDTGWFKSSFSTGASESCVEVRIIGTTVVGLRDSKDQAGRAIWLRPEPWASCLGYLARG